METSKKYEFFSFIISYSNRLCTAIYCFFHLFDIFFPISILMLKFQRLNSPRAAMSRFSTRWFTCWEMMLLLLDTWKLHKFLTSKLKQLNFIIHPKYYYQARSCLHISVRGDPDLAEEGGKVVQCSLPPQQQHLQQPLRSQELLNTESLINLTTTAEETWPRSRVMNSVVIVQISAARGTTVQSKL